MAVVDFFTRNERKLKSKAFLITTRLLNFLTSGCYAGISKLIFLKKIDNIKWHGSYCSYFSYSNFRHRMALHQIEDNIIENHMSLIYIYIFISSLQSIQHGEITCTTDKNYMTISLLSIITYDCHWLNASSSTQLLFNIKHTEPYRIPCGTSLPFFLYRHLCMLTVEK